MESGLVKFLASLPNISALLCLSLFRGRVPCVMAFRLVGRQMVAGAGRDVLGAPTTQIRGYCQQTSSVPDYIVRRSAKCFVTGAVLAVTVIHLVLNPKLNEARERDRVLHLEWEAAKKEMNS